MLYCAVNGQQISEIAVNERGFSYGDGTFTTTKILNGKVVMLSEHIARLKTACQRLAIGYQNFAALQQELTQLASNYDLAVLKVVITAGCGGRGYSRIGASKPTVILSVFDFPTHYFDWQKHGISLGHSGVKLGINPSLSGIKHLNRLEQVLVKNELDDFACDDVVVTDLNNNIIEASSSNLFWFVDGEIFTPEIIHAGVEGVARNKLLELSKLGLLPKIHIVKQQLSTLEQATSIFLTNSLMEIVPVSCYQRKALDIKPVHALQQAYLNHVYVSNDSA